MEVAYTPGKNQTRVEVPDRKKTKLEHFGINYSRKMFNCTGPWGRIHNILMFFLSY